MRAALTVCAVLLLSACSSPSEPDRRWAVPENISYAASLEIDLGQMTKTESGLYWTDLLDGTGDRAVTIDDVIRFHYTIWLPDGTRVRTTRGGVAETKAVLLLIPGLAEGVIGMKQYGVRKLVIPPDLAWPKGNGPIPPLSTIICEVEIVGWN